MFKRSICVIFAVIILGTVVFSVFGEQNEKTDKILLQELVYTATSISDGEKKDLGSYNIAYDFENKVLFETKNYDILIGDERANVYNQKAYYFSEEERLIQYIESEKYNGVEKYKKTYSISYNDTDHTIVIDRNDSFPEITIPDALPYTVNSSYILELGLKKDFSFDELQKRWSCYEGLGAIDEYTLLEEDATKADDIINENPCIRIEQKGLFDTIFWLNSDGYIVRIEQKMDDNYSVIFELTSTRTEAEET